MMLYKNKTWIVALIPLALGACTALDSSSDFSNSIASIDTQLNHVKVIGKEYKPEAKAINGPTILKSSLQVVDVYPLNEKSNLSSFIQMDVSYFQSYDEYKSVSYNGQQLSLQRTQQSASSCNEHCTATQFFTFPISDQDISKASTEGLDFVLASSNNTMKTQFSIPAAYINAIHQTAKLTAGKAPQQMQAPAVKAEPVATTSKAQEMVQYWYAEATAEQQKAFTSWAFENREQVTTAFASDSKPAEMMAYWYEKSTKSEKIDILKWLLER
ncbi:hypothetical protein VHA01S_005_01550 [Vibrio halioticoli NBRC 102217]|uniref:DUF2057 domain-containing protein n=1 Tax=Vibrio halioticoli NBRC 102217 TaxID=1219072 RepID=V5FF82_9VIBR|nr:hypothetical protein [Vibrio halioticoli]GAD88551.1 hypothetical protein VHA01S_005_01550 [Vibrio halioticoli NBRC 102217]